MFAHDLFDIKGGEVSLTADTEDLLEMDELHEAPLLQCLENRYNNDVIYVCAVFVVEIPHNLEKLPFCSHLTIY